MFGRPAVSKLHPPHPYLRRRLLGFTLAHGQGAREALFTDKAAHTC